MRSIVVYATAHDKGFDPSYTLLGESIAALGGSLALSSPPHTFLGNGTFSGGSIFQNGEFRETREPIVADIVLNKSIDFTVPDETWVINHPMLDRACEKHETSRIFHRFCAKSFEVASADTLTDAFDAIPGDVIVLKPFNSYGGKGVWIGKKTDASSADMQYPLLAQELIDTSNGIPGICPGRHDLRLVLFGNQFIDCLLRQPPAGGYVANLSRGGSIGYVSLDLVPQDAKDTATAIDAMLTSFPDRTYCIDFGLHGDGSWKIIELNSPPGLPYPGANHPNPRDHTDRLARHLLTTKRTTDPVIAE